MSFNKYKIKEHLLSFSPRYTITNQDEQLVAEVNRHAFSPHKKGTFINESGDEVLSIFKKIFSLRREYYIQKDGKVIFRVFKTLEFKPKIFVESLVEPEAFYIQGNIWSSEFAFYRENKEFAYVSRNVWKIIDTYQVAIDAVEDQYLILALVIVIDYMKGSRKKG